MITGSADVYELVRAELGDLRHEEFWVLLLKRNGEVLKKIQISSGGMHGTVVDPKRVFQQALVASAASMILVHNHPSGNLKPSAQDIALTRKLVEGGRLMDLPVLDHIIFSDKGYYSFADEGEM